LPKQGESFYFYAFYGNKVRKKKYGHIQVIKESYTSKVIKINKGNSK